MATRLTEEKIDKKKTIKNLNNNSTDDKFETNIMQLTPNLFSDLIKNKIINNKKVVCKDNNLKNTKNEDDDDSSNFRDKDRELKNSIKSKLSLESQDVINMNEEEFNLIIEQLKKRGISKDKGIELQKMRNITRGRNGISK